MGDCPDDLSALMKDANAGDALAYRKLLTSLGLWLRAWIRRHLKRVNRGPEDTEDIVQETLLAIHLKRHTWDATQPLEPWVRAIAHHKLVDALRRRGFREHLDIDDFADVLAAPSKPDSRNASARSSLMAHLSVRERKIVEGVSIEGRSAREVGETIGMSEGAVRVALHRALKVLAAAHRRGE